MSFPFATTAATTATPIDAGLAKRLASSPYVYISPIQSNGKESRCHAEVWYAWMRDSADAEASVVVTVATKGWKAQSVTQGLDRARLWVGDYGRWKGFFSNNEKFRDGGNFLARGHIVKDPALLERLLTEYETKYPEEIADWRDGMRAGGRDGTRVVIRYTPIRAPRP